MLDPEDTTLTVSPAGEKLRAAHADWVKRGSPKPKLVDARGLVNAYLKVQDQLEALELKRAALMADRNEAILAIVKSCGRGRLDLGPKLGIQIPMAKGDVIWFRPENVASARKVL